jgi:hypothetical protein
MTAVILAPGPSLALLASPPPSDLLIGINRAGLAFHCDVVAISDYPLFKKVDDHLLGRPNLLSKQDTLATLKGRLDRFPEVFAAEEIQGVPLTLQWRWKTLTCAMAFAFYRGAKSIDIYGCDWSGTLDYDGTEAGEDRTDRRWNEERACAEDLMRWMGERNCPVTRHARP